jgi:MFS family permease
LRNRWSVLAVLFAVRFTIAFQFQSVAAVAPLLTTKFGVNLADIGLLIGLYFTPGIALSLPGGAIGQRLGDKTAAVSALLLMTAGSLVMAYAEAWHWQMAGRFIAGAGGVILNVQLTKMMTDWFVGHEIATAMAIFVNSWPAGVGIALLTLPAIATAHGAAAAHLAVSALMALGALLITLYQPPAAGMAMTKATARLDRYALVAVMTAGLIWGLFNVGFGMILSFGPSLLVERGQSVTSAGSTISIVLWLSVVSVALGGHLADRMKMPQTIMVGGSLLFAALMVAMARSEATIPLVVALGLISGQPAGAIMSLPAQVLTPPTRAIGMGIFYTLFYAAMMAGPSLAGALAKATGSAAAAFDFGAAVLIACPILLLLFNRLARLRFAAEKT